MYTQYWEATSYSNLQNRKTSSTEIALEYCDQALAIATELGIPLAEECKKLKAELAREVKEIGFV